MLVPDKKITPLYVIRMAVAVFASVGFHLMLGVVLLVSFPALPVATKRPPGEVLTVFLHAALPVADEDKEKKPAAETPKKKKRKIVRVKKAAPVPEPVLEQPPPDEETPPPPPVVKPEERAPEPAPKPEIPFESPVIAPPEEEPPPPPPPPTPEPPPVANVPEPAIPELSETELEAPESIPELEPPTENHEVTVEERPVNPPLSEETLALLREQFRLQTETPTHPPLLENPPMIYRPPGSRPAEPRLLPAEPEEAAVEEEVSTAPVVQPDIVAEGPVVAPELKEEEIPPVEVAPVEVAMAETEKEPAVPMGPPAPPAPPPPAPVIEEPPPEAPPSEAAEAPEPEEAPREATPEPAESPVEEITASPSAPPVESNPPVIVVTEPHEGDTLSLAEGGAVVIRGTVDDPSVKTATVIVNGQPMEVPVRDGKFEARSHQARPENTISVEATNKAGIKGSSPLIRFLTVLFEPPDVLAILSGASSCTGMELHLLKGEHPVSPDYRALVEPKEIDAKVKPLESDPSVRVIMTEVKNAETAVYSVQLAEDPDHAPADCAPRLIVILYGYDPERVRTLVFPRPDPFFNRPGFRIVARFLMPQAYFWDDESWITGQVDNGRVATRFNSDEGIAWKERR